jgi:hypothetical protein
MKKQNTERSTGRLFAAALLSVLILTGMLPFPSALQLSRLLFRGTPFIGSGVLAAEKDSALILGKTAVPNEDGTWTVSCEAAASGNVETLQTRKPVDIVLVLDFTSSMTDAYEGSGSRADALRKAVNGLLDRMVQWNGGMTDAKDLSRVAAVCFSSRIELQSDLTAATGGSVADLKARLEALKPRSITRTDIGLQKAGEMLSASDMQDRRKVVILFTDGGTNGAPNGVSTAFDIDVANAALQFAKQIKDKGALLYTVDIQPEFAENVPGPLPAYEKIPGAVAYDGEHMKSPEAAAPNTTDENVLHLYVRFANLLSSNNPRASDMDTPDASDSTNAGNTGTSSQNYCMTAHSSDALSTVFLTITEEIEHFLPGTGKGAVLRDFIAPPFALTSAPEIATFISSRIKNADGTFSWGEPVKTEALTVAADAASGTVEVSGFDYAANFISDTGHADDPSNYGKKLIVTVRVEARNTFGGNAIPTNKAGSDVYPDDSAQSGPAAEFPVPTADLPVNYAIVSSDVTTYAPDAADISALVRRIGEDGVVTCFAKDQVPDGINNAYVNIQYILKDPTGKTCGTMTIPAGMQAKDTKWEWTEDTGSDRAGKWQIVCTVSPKTEGTQKSGMLSMEPQLHLFHPEVTFRDTQTAYGKEADFKPGVKAEDVPNHLEGVKWVSPDGAASQKEAEPKLLYLATATHGLTVENGPYIVRDRGYVPVTVRIFRKDGDNEREITDYTDYAHCCGLDGCNFAAVNRHEKADFVIHVPAEGESSGTGQTSGGGGQSDTPAAVVRTAVVQVPVMVPAGAAAVPVPAAAAAPASGAETAAGTAAEGAVAGTRRVPATGDPLDALPLAATGCGAALAWAVLLLIKRRAGIAAKGRD